MDKLRFNRSRSLVSSSQPPLNYSLRINNQSFDLTSIYLWLSLYCPSLIIIFFSHRSLLCISISLYPSIISLSPSSIGFGHSSLSLPSRTPYSLSLSYHGLSLSPSGFSLNPISLSLSISSLSRPSLRPSSLSPNPCNTSFSNNSNGLGQISFSFSNNSLNFGPSCISYNGLN